MKPNNNAFPLIAYGETHYGLTKKEYIVTQIIAGMMANKDINSFSTKRELVSYGIEVANQLIHQIDLDGKD